MHPFPTFMRLLQTIIGCLSYFEAKRKQSFSSLFLVCACAASQLTCLAPSPHLSCAKTSFKLVFMSKGERIALDVHPESSPGLSAPPGLDVPFSATSATTATHIGIYFEKKVIWFHLAHICSSLFARVTRNRLWKGARGTHSPTPLPSI